MKTLIKTTVALIALVVGGAPLPWLGPAPVRAQTSLTIYNDGRVLVRRTLAVALPAGASTRRIPLGRLDPASLFSLDSAVAILGISYDAVVDEESVLRRSIGRRVVYRNATSGDTLSALVLGVDPLRLQLPDGRVSFAPPGLALYPADRVAAEATATLALRSARPRDRLGLGYFTEGASWQASYQVVLGRSDARVSGSAVVSSESLRAENAEVQLLAGSVGRAEPSPRPMAMMDKAAAVEARQMPAEERVGDFHVYTLPGRTTILPGVTTVVALFAPLRVRYERAYVVRGLIPFWGYLPQQGDESEAPVEVSYTLKRPQRTEFGDRPLPGGVFRLFRADSAGRLQLVGEAATGHTAPGRDLRLSAGIAFDLTARRVQTSYRTSRDSSRAGIRTVALADYRVTLANGSDSGAVIDVLEERGGEWAVVSSSVPPEKLSSTITRFRIRVPARGQAVLRYRVRVIW